MQRYCMIFRIPDERCRTVLRSTAGGVLSAFLLAACSFSGPPARAPADFSVELNNSRPQPALAATGSRLPLVPSLAPVLSKVSPTVVNISTESTELRPANPLLDDPFFRRFFDLPKQQPQERIVQGLGSGVIISAAQGYIVTSQHVIKQASSITITLHDGRQLPATVVTEDATNDLALLHIEAGNLQAIDLAVDDPLEVGDFVIAIGNPFGLGQTATAGIVSALGRNGPADQRDFIQTDASINPGNSGGPLVNLNGQLVGISSAILAPGGSSVGIGFAIPVSRIRRWLSPWLS